jgi:hypothetical protein
VEGHSDQNIQYSVSMPDQHIPFGCSFPVDCWFAPLSKNIRLRFLTVQVVEKHNLRFDATATESVRDNIRYVMSAKKHIVFTEQHNLTHDAQSSKTEWRMKMPVSLPRSLRHCSQSISSQNIKVEHMLAITADFQDEQGRAFARVGKPVQPNKS